MLTSDFELCHGRPTLSWGGVSDVALWRGRRT